MVERDYLQPDFYHFNDDSIWLVKEVSKILQTYEESSEFCFSSVLICDIGAGCGIIGLELLQRFPNVKGLVLIEPQIEFEWFLQANAQSFLTKDLYQKTKVLQSSMLGLLTIPEWHSDDTILLVSNPPYFLPGQGRICPDKRRHMCRHWPPKGVEEWEMFLKKIPLRHHTAFYWTSPANVKASGHHVLGTKKLVQLRCIGDL